MSFDESNNFSVSTWMYKVQNPSVYNIMGYWGGDGSTGTFLSFLAIDTAGLLGYRQGTAGSGYSIDKIGRASCRERV